MDKARIELASNRLEMGFDIFAVLIRNVIVMRFLTPPFARATNIEDGTELWSFCADRKDQDQPP